MKPFTTACVCVCEFVWNWDCQILATQLSAPEDVTNDIGELFSEHTLFASQHFSTLCFFYYFSVIFIWIACHFFCQFSVYTKLAIFHIIFSPPFCVCTIVSQVEKCDHHHSGSLFSDLLHTHPIRNGIKVVLSWYWNRHPNRPTTDTAKCNTSSANTHFVHLKLNLKAPNLPISLSLSIVGLSGLFFFFQYNWCLWPSHDC